MGKIKDIINEFKQKLNEKQLYIDELLFACKEGYVKYKLNCRDWNANVICVYVCIGNLSKVIGIYAPKCTEGHFIVNHQKYVDENILTNTLVVSGDVYYQVSLEELIKHGAKEIKEDELVS